MTKHEGGFVRQAPGDGRLFRVIYVDMDGVLADFVGAALELFGRTDLAEGWPNNCGWPKGEYRIEKALGISTDCLWVRINAEGAEWWENLPIHSWCNSLCDELREYAPVLLVTKLPPEPGSKENAAIGKIRWIEKHFLGDQAFIMVGEDKAPMGRPGALLIDDSEAEVEGFRAAGGEGIVFPRPWNNGIEQADGWPDLLVLAEMEKRFQRRGEGDGK